MIRTYYWLPAMVCVACAAPATHSGASTTVAPSGTGTATVTSQPDGIAEVIAAEAEVIDEPPATEPEALRFLPGGLGLVDLAIGDGLEAAPGAIVHVHYVGRLDNGQQFDSSYEHGEPIAFELGAGRVIRGWDAGLVGMLVGGKRRLLVPPALAYGARGKPGAIPPNAILEFEVELVAIE